MSRLLFAYNAFVVRRPLLAPVAMSFTLFGMGDVLCQQIVEKKGRQHDLIRTARLATYGGLIFAPIIVPWYKLLDRLPLKSKATQVAGRVFLDQFAFSPVMLSVFFTATTLMDGKSIDEARSKVQSSLKPTLIANWALFIPFQTINMAVIPLQHRLLAVNVISLFWNTYLSMMAASKPGGEPVVKARAEEA